MTGSFLTASVAGAFGARVSRRHAGAWLGICAVGLLGFLLIVLPDVGYGRMPGDLGDGRFNNFILEHGYQWLTRRTDSFWHAYFFYPFPLTTAFSVNHLGTVVVYSFFRIIGWDQEDAYRGWFSSGFVVNYLACAYSLRRLGYSVPASAFGAFLFAYGLPITGQTSHSQILYRFGVPLAVMSLAKFRERPALPPLLGVGFWSVWQFYCEIYTGYFLALLLVAFILASAFVRGRLVTGVVSYWPSKLIAAWRGASIPSRIGFLVGSLLLCIALAALFFPYVQATKLYGFKRGWDEIATALPRFASYLLSNHSYLWKFSWSAFDALPLRHEHGMFMGGAPFLAIATVLALKLGKRGDLGPDFLIASLAILLLFVLTLWVDGHSLYRFIAELPGANAIRAVTRIAVVLLFPAAILVAAAIDRLSGAAIPGVARYGFQLVIVGLLVFECSDIFHYSTLKTSWLDRMRAVEALLPKSMPPDPILQLAAGLNEQPGMREIDAMVLAQDRGWPTLNGYSGNAPPGHVMTLHCRDAIDNIVAANDFFDRPDRESFERIARRVVPVGYSDCGPDWIDQELNVTRFAGPLPLDLMAATKIEIDGVSVIDNALSLEVSVTNNGHMVLPARSTTRMPVEIALRFFPVNPMSPDSVDLYGWDFRKSLASDVPPGQTVKFTVPMPLIPKDGAYLIGATVGQETVAWFHDHGSQVAISKQRVTLHNGTWSLETAS